MRKELSSLFAGLIGKKDSVDSYKPQIVFPFHGILTPEQVLHIENIVGYQISDIGVYERALTHRSFLQVRPELKLESNERLEFLGDAVLDMIVSDYLFLHHDKLPEGTLSKLRSNIVNKDTLIDCAGKLGIGELLIMSYGAQAAMKKASAPSMLADAMESLIAAVYLDKGYREVEKFVLERFMPLASGYMSRADKNYKSRLQELLQSESKLAPNYVVVEKEGPDHDKKFTVQAYSGEQQLAIGIGENKQKAEQDAARNSLNILTKGNSI